MSTSLAGYLLVGASVLLGLGASPARASTTADELASRVLEVACVTVAYPETLHGEQTGRVVAEVEAGTTPESCAVEVRGAAAVRIDSVLAAGSDHPALLILSPKTGYGLRASHASSWRATG